MCKFHIFAHVIVCHFLQKTRDRNLSCADVFFCAVVATSTSRNFDVPFEPKKPSKLLRLRATSCDFDRWCSKVAPTSMPHGLFDAVDCMRGWHKPGHVGVEMKPVSGGQVSLHFSSFLSASTRTPQVAEDVRPPLHRVVSRRHYS
jgi:hypothetical protein